MVLRRTKLLKAGECRRGRRDDGGNSEESGEEYSDRRCKAEQLMLVQRNLSEASSRKAGWVI